MSTSPPAHDGGQARWLAAAALLGALAVALGAFGAHGLSARFSSAPEGPTFRGWWETAASYHLAHALALGLASQVGGRATRAARVAFAVGVVVFSGTLYAMALGAPRWLGAVTPLGGVSLIAGWILLAVGALAADRGSAASGDQ